MQYRFKSTVPTFSIIFSRYLGKCIRILYFFRIFSSTYQEKNEENLDYFRIFKQESSCKSHRTICKTASRTISRTTLANSVYCQHCSHWKHKVLGRLTALFHMDIDLRVIIALLLLLLLITKTRHTLQKMVKMLKQQIGFVV